MLGISQCNICPKRGKSTVNAAKIAMDQLLAPHGCGLRRAETATGKPLAMLANDRGAERRMPAAFNRT